MGLWAKFRKKTRQCAGGQKSNDQPSARSNGCNQNILAKYHGHNAHAARTQRHADPYFAGAPRSGIGQCSIKANSSYQQRASAEE
jgi:hypothetical protein